MKKCKNLILMIMITVISILMIPSSAFAKSIDLSIYNSSTLQEAFSDEEIEYDFSNYEETEDQITIYLFRGHGCAYCSKFLNYLADTLLDKYGNMFKVVTYEVWYDSTNAELFQDVAEFMGDDASGVPYIVIGDKTFVGYAESFNSDIENAITTLYNSKDKYDVFEEMAKESSEETTTTISSNTVAIVLWNIVITAIGVGIVVYNNNQTKRFLEKEIQSLKKIVEKESRKDKKGSKK